MCLPPFYCNFNTFVVMSKHGKSTRLDKELLLGIRETNGHGN